MTRIAFRINYFQNETKRHDCHLRNRRPTCFHDAHRTHLAREASTRVFSYSRDLRESNDQYFVRCITIVRDRFFNASLHTIHVRYHLLCRWSVLASTFLLICPFCLHFCSFVHSHWRKYTFKYIHLSYDSFRTGLIFQPYARYVYIDLNFPNFPALRLRDARCITVASVHRWPRLASFRIPINIVKRGDKRARNISFPI